MYDYDRNGKITKEDIRTLLSYVPITTFAKKKGSVEGLLTR